MNSSKRINYSIRVAKNIERKMIKDMLLKIGFFFPMKNYTYIGFGSKYFSDFLLFHKHLHLNKMVSIEGDIGNKKKYEFNKPLKCIELIFGMSHEILPDLQISSNFIAWLDYDGLLNQSCLNDIATMVSKSDSGSVFIVSYNSRPLKSAELEKNFPDISAKDRPIAALQNQLGENFIPHDIDTRGLSDWDKYSKLLRQVVINCIESRLILLNQGVSDKLLCKQIINFNYQDGVEMSTIGFVFIRENEIEKLKICDFSQFDFFRENENIYHIDIPNLTAKEIKALTECMPEDTKINIKFNGIIPATDISKFEKIYKYLPNFSDAEAI
jgi:hypothetical protein